MSDGKSRSSRSDRVGGRGAGPVRCHMRKSKFAADRTARAGQMVMVCRWRFVQKAKRTGLHSFKCGKPPLCRASGFLLPQQLQLRVPAAAGPSGGACIRTALPRRDTRALPAHAACACPERWAQSAHSGTTPPATPSKMERRARARNIDGR